MNYNCRYCDVKLIKSSEKSINNHWVCSNCSSYYIFNKKNKIEAVSFFRIINNKTYRISVDFKQIKTIINIIEECGEETKHSQMIFDKINIINPFNIGNKIQTLINFS
jgi:hypothetical protein